MAAPHPSEIDYQITFSYHNSIGDGLTHIFNVTSQPLDASQSSIRSFKKISIQHGNLLYAITKLGLEVHRDRLHCAEKSLTDVRASKQPESECRLYIKKLLENFSFTQTQKGSRIEEALDRLDLLACQARAEESGKTYSCPKFEAFLDACAKALSCFEDSPERYLLISRKDKARLANEVLQELDVKTHKGPNTEMTIGLSRLERQIASFTKLPVTLEPAKIYPYVKPFKRAGTYLNLTIGAESRLLFIGPIDGPFQFISQL